MKRIKKGSVSMKDSVGVKIIEGLKEFTDALESGEKIAERFTCRTVMLDLVPLAYGPDAVKATRKLLGASQGIFAQFLGVSPKSVRAWEQGVNSPSDIACRFMDEIQRNPDFWRKRLMESVTVRRDADVHCAR
jgi:putative transcriptional regulator